ncbi:MAG: type IV toxin-antitoxin system AbiEi family antitoxin domain-containing protein [Deltaproteobacteria bacterium]|nr:type IV toxin-antitoxin system AbiEi family antitoxin domain-containing protein [Deltaproteobacteria bacterium]
MFSISEAKARGFSHSRIYRMAKAGKLEKLAPNVYKYPSVLIDPVAESFAVACKRLGPDAAVAGPSALGHRGLVESPPQQLWMLVPPNILAPRRSNYRLIRSRSDLSLHMKSYRYFRVTSLERTLVELLHLATKIGPEAGIRAIREAVADGRTTLDQMVGVAKDLGYQKSISKYWEAILI